MTYDFDHYNALEQSLHLMKSYLEGAKNENETKWFQHRVDMIQKEMDGEIKFLEKRGVDCSVLKPIESDAEFDALLDELFS